MEYIVKSGAARKIYTFYGNVTKKYRHTYDKTDYKRNVSDALKDIYRIENGLLRREPRFSRWKEKGYTWPTPTSGITHTSSKAIP